MDTGERTLAERMRGALADLSPAERRLVRRCLVVEEPEAFATLATLSERAGVSSPTVLRCLAKLGFEQWADFRRAALDDLAARHDSALAQAGRLAAGPRDEGARARAVAEGLAAAMRGSFERLDADDLAAAAALLADPARRLLLAGGRFSHSLAEQLHAHLTLLRPGVELLGFSSQGRHGRVVDAGRGHVLAVFDMRRYQRDTVELAWAAKRRRARILLVTDPWMSPIADWADVVLAVEVRSASPFDSLVPSLALVEALVDAVRARLGEAATRRLAALEAAVGAFEWTGHGPSARTPAAPRTSGAEPDPAATQDAA